MDMKKKQKRYKRWNLLLFCAFVVWISTGCQIQGEHLDRKIHYQEAHKLIKSGMTPESAEASADIDVDDVDNIDNTERNHVQIRTEQVFDTDAYKGLLTVRYLYLNADQKSGDAIYIETPDGKKMLIDAGFVETGDKVTEYLEKMGVKRLDYAVATHPHHDHIGGYLSVLEKIEVGEMITIPISHTTKTYERFIRLVEDKGIPVTYAVQGDQIELGKEVTIDVLNPAPETSSSFDKKRSTESINNLSLVLKMTHGKRTFLFTGDLYKQRESELVKLHRDVLDADVMDASHHGDKTSNSSRFIKAVRPQYTIISANILQSKLIYDRYRKYGSEVYVTGFDGTVLIVSDGDELKVITELDRTSDILD